MENWGEWRTGASGELRRVENCGENNMVVLQSTIMFSHHLEVAIVMHGLMFLYSQPALVEVDFLKN